MAKREREGKRQRQSEREDEDNEQDQRKKDGHNQGVLDGIVDSITPSHEVPLQQYNNIDALSAVLESPSGSLAEEHGIVNFDPKLVARQRLHLLLEAVLPSKRVAAAPS
jgi:hypothetical protein